MKEIPKTLVAAINIGAFDLTEFTRRLRRWEKEHRGSQTWLTVDGKWLEIHRTPVEGP